MTFEFISISPRRLIGHIGSTALVAVIFLLVQFAGALAEVSTSPHQRALLSLGTVESLDDTGRGTLVFRRAGSEDLYLAPLVATEVSIDIGGIIARSRVRQTFVNPTDQWLEGVYVFPLPESGSVDRLEMVVGERTILGVIKERDEARRSYEAARAKGQRAALLESDRPNVFTSSVANIAPGASIAITFEYQQKLRYDEGAFRLRFPMVVAPRYQPRDQVASAGGGPIPAGGAPGSPEETGAIPVVTGEVRTNPISLSIVLQPGFPVAELKSPYHEINVSQEADDHYRISLREGPVPADRDFELVWTPAKGAEPTAAIFSESTATGHYLMAMVMPPTLAAEVLGIAREVIFVIDTSGSMEGTSIEQAKLALTLAIDRLDGRDRFNVIRFSDHTAALFDQPQPADDERRALAKTAVEGLAASGGTNMAPAIELALSGQAPKGFLRQVVFITDGAVSNEQQLFRIVHQRLGASRFFTVGIGSAPNSYFMVEAAAAGRGTYTTIGAVSQVGERMGELFAKLERPILSDLRVDWPAGAVVEGSKDVLPDLYAGEPVVLTARISDLRGYLSIRGCLGAQPWQATLPLGNPAQVDGVAKLWARDRIDDLTTAMFDGRDPKGPRQQIVALALGHSLVTEYTSLVAVDNTPARPGEENLTRRNVPINLPDGWVPEEVMPPPIFRIEYDVVALPDATGVQPESMQLMEIGTLAARSVPPAPATSLRIVHSPVQPRLAGRSGAEGDVRTGIWIPASEFDMSQPTIGGNAEFYCG